MPPLAARQWRSLAEAERDPAFVARAAAEFPALAEAIAHPASRRQVLRLLGASLALAGLGGCGDGASPDGRLVPAVVAPPDIVPGIANHYATASLGGPSPVGIVVTHQMGRPIKVEGNPHHPASLGATDVFAQAVLLDFYDPDRAAGITAHGVPSGREALLTTLAGKRAEWARDGGTGLVLLTASVTSPTLARQIGALLAQYPGARWVRCDPLARTTATAGAAMAYARAVEVVPDLAGVRCLAGFESDLLSAAPGHLAHARHFAAARNPTRTEAMSRVYAVEATPSLLGTAADHRIVASPAVTRRLLWDVAGAVLDGTRPDDARAAAIADDLRQHAGAALLHAGPDVPADLHALVHAVNERLGGRDRTFSVLEPAVFAPADATPVDALVADMLAGRVASLLVLGGNPVFTASGADFAAAMARVPFSLATAPSETETTRAATWFVPEAHDWEGWSDARAFDGTVTVLQPQSLPLYGGTSRHTLLGWLAGPDERSARDLVRETSRAGRGGMARRGRLRHARRQRRRPGARGVGDVLPPRRAEPARCPGGGVPAGPEPARRAARQQCVAAGTAAAADQARLGQPAADRARPGGPRAAGQRRRDPPDHRRAHRGGAGVRRARTGGRRGRGTVRLWPQVVGRRRPRHRLRRVPPAAGRRRAALGAHRQASRARQHRPPRRAGGQRQPRGHRAPRDPRRRAPRHRAPAGSAVAVSRPPPLSKQQWGMSIDLNACIGCNACVVACQAENNMPTVGHEQVLREREMHWLRIDRYYEGGRGRARHVSSSRCCACIARRRRAKSSAR